MIKLLNYLKKKQFILYLALFLLGSLYVFAFPPYSIFALSFISIIGASFLFREARSLKNVLLMALSFGGGVCLFGFYWIYYAVNYIFHNNILSSVVFIGFSILFSTVFIPCIYIIYKFGRNLKLFPFVAILAWFSYEIAKQFILGGFPWFMTAQIWDNNIQILQFASVVGVIGLSALSLIFILLPIFFFTKAFQKQKYLVLGFYILFSSLVYLYGDLRIKDSVHDIVKKEISLRLVQPNINQDDKQNFYKLEQIVLETSKLAFNANKIQPQYIILPEVAFSTDLNKRGDIINKLRKSLDKDTYLLLGLLNIEENDIYNSFRALNKNPNKDSSYYNKRNLVPFGEYIPFGKTFPWLKKLVGMESFSAGTKNLIFNFAEYERFSVLICFEVIFTTFGLSNKNIDWLLNISNEAWFNSSIERAQNLSLSRFRAIEIGIPLVKLSNTGSSAIIDYMGVVSLELVKDASISIDIYLPIITKSTIYTRVFS